MSCFCDREFDTSSGKFKKDYKNLSDRNLKSKYKELKARGGNSTPPQGATRGLRREV